MATDLERRQQGEQFDVMDQPNLPDTPSFPKRPLFFLMGLAAGLALGVGLTMLFEHMDAVIRTEADLSEATQLPLLAVIGFAGRGPEPGSGAIRGGPERATSLDEESESRTDAGEPIAMYKRFFNLRSNPFNITPDPRFLYRMPHILEALACLRYGISERRGFLVLTGEVGTGKTTLIHTALQSFDQNKIVSSFIFNPRVNATEFLEFMMADFGIAPQGASKASMLMQLNRWLIERYKRNETCVVIVDEAQNLSVDVLEEIRLLTNLETASDKLLQIVLSGQPEFEEKLREPGVRQLRQRIAMWCRTRTLTVEETGAYIAERLSIAGTQEEIFPADSVQLIHDLSRGIPRTINLLCEHSLISSYAEGARVVTRPVIEAVGDDLGLAARRSPGLVRSAEDRPDSQDKKASSMGSDESSRAPADDRKELEPNE